MSQIGERIKDLPLRREVADCAEWSDGIGQTLYVRELSGEERLEYERAQLEGGLNSKGDLDKRKFVDVMKQLRQTIVVQTLTDSDGTPLFDDVADLESVSGEVVARVADQAMSVSRLLPADVEEIAGNLDDSQNAAAG